jgi:hypothetical protein
MTVPSTADLQKRANKLAQFKKRIGPDGRPIEKQVISVVRSAIRQAWMKSDVKLAFMYSRTIPDMDDTTRTKWLYECEICRNRFKETEIEVDHKYGHHVFTKLEEFNNYFDKILMVRSEDLQILCKDNKKKGYTGCHSIKTLSESHGLSFEDARATKQAIEFNKKSVKNVVALITRFGYNAASTKDKRRQQLVQIFKENPNAASEIDPV